MDHEAKLVRDTGGQVYLRVREGRVYLLARMDWAKASDWLSPDDARWMATALIHAANAADGIDNREGLARAERAAGLFAPPAGPVPACNCGMGGQLHESTCPQWAPIVPDRFVSGY